jgi:RNA polymerase sigma-70 factor (ECF subfamily)
MTAIGRAMGERESRGPSAGDPAALLEEHLQTLGRVAMALLGDAERVEQALEQVAREACARGLPEGEKPIVWLLGLVRSACATQRSRLSLGSRATSSEEAPKTARLGAAGAVPARAALAALKPTERDAVVLCLVGGLDAAAVARACNVDLTTAKARIACGLEQLLERETREEGGAR